MSTADLLARLSVDPTLNRVVYRDNVGHETDDLTGITITGAQNGGLMLSLPTGADSSFIGHSIELDIEIQIIDNVLGLSIYMITESLMTGYLWTA